MKITDERPDDEKVDDIFLRAVFARQLKVSLMVQEIAEQLYDARCLWLGDQSLDWADLTPRQQHGYRAEVERLIKQVNA